MKPLQSQQKYSNTKMKSNEIQVLNMVQVLSTVDYKASLRSSACSQTGPHQWIRRLNATMMSFFPNWLLRFSTVLSTILGG